MLTICYNCKTKVCVNEFIYDTEIKSIDRPQSRTVEYKVMARVKFICPACGHYHDLEVEVTINDDDMKDIVSKALIELEED